MKPIDIFIGTSSNGEDADSEMVLEYTLRKNTKATLNITWMKQSLTEDPWYGWSTRRWSTPFSGYRWAIPEVCGFKGRAIYMDEDMLNLRDINDLFEMDLNGKPFAARRGKRFGGHEFCVMVIDCEKCEPLLMPIKRQKNMEDTHHRYINTFSGNDDYVQEMDSRWNCHDGDDRRIEDIWHLHFTEMSTQPWLPKWFTGMPVQHPRQDLVELWNDTYHAALKDGWAPKIPNAYPIKYNIIGK